MDITVITEITACLRLARKYRAATKSSNVWVLIADAIAETGLHRGSNASWSGSSLHGRSRCLRRPPAACRRTALAHNLRPFDAPPRRPSLSWQAAFQTDAAARAGHSTR